MFLSLSHFSSSLKRKLSLIITADPRIKILSVINQENENIKQHLNNNKLMKCLM